MRRRRYDIVRFPKIRKIQALINRPVSWVYSLTITLLALAIIYPFVDAGVDNVTENALLSVIDGDTVRYQGKSLRLLGVDTPEPSRYGNAECPEEASLGNRATAFTKFVVIGKPVTIEWSGQQDRFGRDLVNIRLGGGDLLSDLLIQYGFGKPWRGRQVDWCSILR